MREKGKRGRERPFCSGVRCRASRRPSRSSWSVSTDVVEEGESCLHRQNRKRISAASLFSFFPLGQKPALRLKTPSLLHSYTNTALLRLLRVVNGRDLEHLGRDWDGVVVPSVDGRGVVHLGLFAMRRIISRRRSEREERGTEERKESGNGKG